MTLDKELASAITTRPMEKDDVRLVLDSWLKSYRISPWAGCVPNHLYYDVHHECIEQLLARGAEVLVAAAKHDKTRILGWICTERTRDLNVIHFIYVKDPFRQRGLASHLLETVFGTQENRIHYTFRTRDGACLIGEHWVHSPEIARRK